MDRISGILGPLLARLPMAGEQPVAVEPAFPAAAVWQLVQHTARARPMMTFAAWLWRTGVRDPEAVVAMVRECLERGVAQPYAYFARGGEGRMRHAAQGQVRAHRAEERAR